MSCLYGFIRDSRLQRQIRPIYVDDAYFAFFPGVTVMLFEVFRTIVLRDEEKVGLGNWILIVFCRGVPVSRQKDGGVQMSTGVVFLL